MRKTTLLAVLLLLAAAVVTASEGDAGLLDGRTFRGETGEKGKAGEPEDFVFADGRFDPVACHAYGFAATPYTASVDGEVTTFVAEHTNDKGERMRWSGTVRGTSLEGTMVFWDAAGNASDWWFRGSLAE
jgi:hypothetical protein